MSQQQATELESRLKMVEMEREALKVQVNKLKVVQQEKQLVSGMNRKLDFGYFTMTHIWTQIRSLINLNYGRR